MDVEVMRDGIGSCESRLLSGVAKPPWGGRRYHRHSTLLSYPSYSMKTRFFRYLCLLLISAFALPLSAQYAGYRQPTAGELKAQLQKLQVLGSALYLAAHPDDENTRLIAYLANVEKVETGYLSLTRGDGGQNLIASDIRELLGLTRTEELLAARRVDGGEQFFSRANDFGYSKDPDETFTIWDRDQVLADAVWVIRKFRPDVIVNRFDHRTPGSTHGHHTASAILGVEAFELAGDPTAFPEQLKYVEVWQPRRLFFNTSWWFYGSQEAFDKADKSRLVEVDVNRYLPKRGQSVAEIAAISRSQHKSQGFGSSGARDASPEYLELIEGDLPKDPTDLFGGIETTWDRVEDGAGIGRTLARIEIEFRDDDPAASVPKLLYVRQRMAALAPSHYRDRKLAELDELIVGCLGLYLAATTDDAMITPGEELTIETEVTQRLGEGVSVSTPQVLPAKSSKEFSPLTLRTPLRDTLKITLPATADISSPYWLRQAWRLGTYTVDDQQLRGKPESDDPVMVAFDVQIRRTDATDPAVLRVLRPVAYTTTDRVKGEIFEPLEIVPAITVRTEETSYLFASAEPRAVQVRLTAHRAGTAGRLQLVRPADWQVSPAHVDFTTTRKGEEQLFTFMLTPPAGQSTGQIVPQATLSGQPESDYHQKMVTIAHDHIPTQLVALDASVPVVRVALETRGRNIGYLMGAGDAVPEALRSIGYNVTLLEEADFSSGQLARFDAIVVGVRAYNTLDRLPVYQPTLLDYVREGGTLVVQYNTSRGLELPDEEIGPYPLRLSRDRVTVEEAPVRFLVPAHPVLTTPNRLTPADFDGWVQERGLYFPDQWDERYTAILSSNDPGEPARDGGLLVASYGKGHYVYTGYSFFRELPAGVPGAYRLFVNLISLGGE